MMILFIVFWTLVIFLSIFWYGALLFYVGAKGGKEIIELTRKLGRRQDSEKKP